MKATPNGFMLKPKTIKILKSASEKITKKEKKNHINCSFYNGKKKIEAR